jgi:hypothetical protein
MKIENSARLNQIETMMVRCSSAFVFTCAVAIVFVILFSGCKQQSSSSDKVEHEEHFPSHWPVTLFAASDRLTRLYAGDAVELTDTKVSFEQEWVDLFRWLPELAADSELTKSDFDKVDAISTRFAIPLEKMYGGKSSFDKMRSVDGMPEALTLLQQICNDEQKRLDAIERIQTIQEDVSGQDDSGLHQSEDPEGR